MTTDFLTSARNGHPLLSALAVLLSFLAIASASGSRAKLIVGVVCFLIVAGAYLAGWTTCRRILAGKQVNDLAPVRRTRFGEAIGGLASCVGALAYFSFTNSPAIYAAMAFPMALVAGMMGATVRHAAAEGHE